MFDHYSDDIILVSSAVENLKAQIKKFIEPLTEDHGPTSTSASVSGSKESLCSNES